MQVPAPPPRAAEAASSVLRASHLVKSLGFRAQGLGFKKNQHVRKAKLIKKMGYHMLTMGNGYRIYSRLAFKQGLRASASRFGGRALRCEAGNIGFGELEGVKPLGFIVPLK